MADLALHAWPEIAAGYGEAAVLLGNGFSRSVSDKFSYASLFAVAQVDPNDRELFDRLGTVNFERVLDDLEAAQLIFEQHGYDPKDVATRRAAIRDSLVTAIRENHVPWNDAQAALGRIRESLSPYGLVFSTNYDLLPYWAFMNEPAGFGDCFWNNDDGGHRYFDSANSAPNSSITNLVLYVHGGLHLYLSPDGRTYKRLQAPHQNLLDLVGTGYMGSELPLIVSEGRPHEKLAAIGRSDYLRHAYTQLAQYHGPLVIFGHHLDCDHDGHLLEAIKTPERPVAISVHTGGGSAETQEFIGRVAQSLGDKSQFFDASSHPLGATGGR